MPSLLGNIFQLYDGQSSTISFSLVEKEYALLGSAVVDNKVDGIEK